MRLTSAIICAAVLTGAGITPATAQGCDAAAADRARSTLNRYLGENPEKRSAAGQLYARITKQMGGDIKPAQTCEAVARMMAELQSKTNG